ncbi:MAG: hypothetical protein K2N47_00280, partial [Clostridia bacterium]|nr:hypothetical protein [Clostridia bacterium]
LDSSQYTVGTRIMYAEDKTKTPIEVHHFTPTVGGVYTIYKDITLGDQKKTYSYNIYVASATANVGFDGAPSIKVNRDGYSISGPVTNATGVLYAYSSKTEITDITPEKVKELGKGYQFKADKINFQFENDNSGNYFIYYALFNMHGDPTQQYYQEAKGVTAANFSSKTYYLDANGIEIAGSFNEKAKYYEKVAVGRIAVTTVNIKDANDLESALTTNDSSTIYLLTADIDMSAKTSWKASSFYGLLNGLGHTIKNFTIKGESDSTASLISKLEGGTIENVKFENIDITNSKNKVGIIATTYGGFLHNIAMTDIHVKGAVRVGALVGQAMTGDLYVDQISLINTPNAEKYYEKQAAGKVNETNFRLDTYYSKVGDEFVKQTEFEAGKEYYIRRVDIEGERSAAVIGFIQASQATESTKTYIDNVYVDSVIGGAVNKYVGGVVGSADDQNAKDVLEIDHVFSKVTIYSNTYAGGVLGSHNKGWL